MLTNTKGHVSQVLDQTVTAHPSHGSQESAMSPTKRYAKKQCKDQSPGPGASEPGPGWKTRLAIGGPVDGVGEQT